MSLTPEDVDAVLLSMPEDVFAARNVKPLFDAIERIVAVREAAAVQAVVERLGALADEWDAEPYPKTGDAGMYGHYTAGRFEAGKWIAYTDRHMCCPNDCENSGAHR